MTDANTCTNCEELRAGIRRFLAQSPMECICTVEYTSRSMVDPACEYHDNNYALDELALLIKEPST